MFSNILSTLNIDIMYVFLWIGSYLFQISQVLGAIQAIYSIHMGTLGNNIFKKPSFSKTLNAEIFCHNNKNRALGILLCCI